MSDQPNTNSALQADDFANEVDAPQESIFREYLAFLRYNKKWWLTPILLALLVAGAAVITSGSAAAPFIYALF